MQAVQRQVPQRIAARLELYTQLVLSCWTVAKAELCGRGRCQRTRSLQVTVYNRKVTGVHVYEDYWYWQLSARTSADNADLEKMVDTSDEWIVTRTGSANATLPRQTKPFQPWALKRDTRN